MAEQDEKGMWRVRCAPQHPVVATGITDRALGRMIRATVDQEPRNEAEEDLVGDVFFTLWRNNVKTVEQPRNDRVVNKALIDWTMSTPDFQQARASAVGNLPAAMVSSGFLWASLTTEEALQDALKKQDEAAKKEEEADQHYQDMAEKMQAGNQAGAEEAQQKAEQCQQEAQALSEQAAGMVEKLKANPLGQGMIKQIAKQASDKAEEVAAMMDGWGVGSEDLTMSDATEIAQMAMAGQSALKKLSELIGRFAKISMKTAELTKAGYTGAVVEPDLTQDIARVFPTERAYLSQKAPPYIRAQYVSRLFTGGGLLGWKPKFEGKRKGAFVALVDRSGSMYRGKLDVAKAICLGIGRAIIEDKSMVERRYLMAYFDDDVHNLYITDEDSWQKHVEWAGVDTAGGTDFDDALNFAVDKIKDFKDHGVSGADILFITDGEAYVSPDVMAKLNKLKEEVGTRILVVLIGASYADRQIQELADTLIVVRDTDFTNNADKIVSDLTEQIVKAAMN